MNYISDELQLKDVDASALTDIKDIEVDFTRSVVDRLREFIAQTSSPYLFRVNGKAVKIVFDKSSSMSFEEGVIGAIKNILASNP